MKKITFILLASFTLLGLTVSAQDDKAIKKEWEKKKKEMDPLELKRITEENANLGAKAADLQSQLDSKDQTINALNEEITKLKTTAANTIAVPKETNETDVSANSQVNNPSPSGLVFKVQIGAFKDKDLSKYFENNKNFSGDVDGDGTKKYTLGYFTDYWEAENFKKYLREMGVKDAWIVAYKGNTRVEIKDALEGVVK
jgi:hypothetical protein